MDIYLASTSPRRRQLLSEILPEFISCSPKTEEKEYPDLSPKQKAVRRCKDKCIAAVNQIKGMDAVVISGDTVVDFKGQTLDKPKDENRAYDMIASLSGNYHFVHTAVSVYFGRRIFTFCETARVHFKRIPEDAIRRYVKEDTAYDKRGGYGIQTEFGIKYIDEVSGDYYTVVGLPVERLKKLLIFLNIL